MNGDPVEEGGQAVRQGFLQALQTAHTTNALFRSRGGESRSRAESEQRLANEAAKNQRSWIEHQARLGNLGTEQELSMAKIAEVRARIDNAAKITEVDVRHKEGQIIRAETDLARRELDGELSRQQSSEVHAARIAGYTNREAREVALHELDVELKELMIEIRRRAAGFTDTLHHSDERTGAAKAAAAQFAAADATHDLSPDAEAASQAYEERFIHDIGLDPEDYFANNGAYQSDRRPHGVDDDVGGLAADLTMDAHLHHEFDYLTGYLAPTNAPAAETIVDAEIVEDGEWIESAVSATAVHDIDPTAADPDLTSGGADPTPARATGTELEMWRGDPDMGRGR
ncbi:hypothetical protein NN3_00550 [Nocardia neocaledoniensis NBRC 108232]|uniref:Uncharacterized protein n=1 Tax=Nocardia neocaledoniensis TaxID=236511 RepID=A0A317NGD5_9NOCA|nr:hypothetical protein [Nocardia neocaledoniensis]PWV74456.1 hypothetical protein DFR69_106267 [Nocardia neocaledoniensis]GEM29048.1 hypothetical protein NN3_00550 [Nocardia neocaledoniensis NBRC 108232]